MSELPEGWAVAQIGELCDLINGKAFKPSDWTDKGLPIVRIQNLNNPDAPYNHFDGDVPDKFKISDGELLFAWSGTPGTSFGAHVWRGGDAVLNQHIFRVLYDDRIVSRDFFKLAINHKLDELIGKAHGGVGLRHVTKGKFEETQVAIPPIAEQERIISKVEVLSSFVSIAQSELDHLPKLVEKFRQSVLKKAFSGELTRLIRDQSSWPEWRTVPLSDLLKDGPTNGYSPPSGKQATGTLSLKLTATTKGVLDLSEKAIKRLTVDIPPESKFWLKKGDILVQRANSIEYVGATAVFDGPENTYIYPDLMMRLRVSSEPIRNYLWRFLNSEAARSYFRANATGVAGNMPKINGKILRNLHVPFPSELEIDEVVNAIESAFSRIDPALKEIAMSLNHLQRLRKAIHNSAMEGHLVSQDPDDEAIEVLLHQIREERAAQPKGRKRAARGRSGKQQQTTKGAKDMGDRKRSDVTDSHLSELLQELGGAAEARELWQKSDMQLDEFYKQLRDEVSSGRIKEAEDKERLVLGDAA